MAIKRTLITKAADAFGEEKLQTIASVNPAATNAQIDTFCRGFIGLSKNTYLDTIRRDEESVNEAIAEEG